jgi:hypothetical protein
VEPEELLDRVRRAAPGTLDQVSLVGVHLPVLRWGAARLSRGCALASRA